MNWGHGIFLVIIAFLISMFGMVYLASQQTNDMIDKDYYARELKHQLLIDAAASLQTYLSKYNLPSPLSNQTSGQLDIQVPTALCSHISNGKIEMLKINNQKQDRVMPFEPDNSSGKQSIQIPASSIGFYKIRLYWTNEATPYYFEQDLQIK